jgi:hypothetical protein
VVGVCCGDSCNLPSGGEVERAFGGRGGWGYVLWGSHHASVGEVERGFGGGGSGGV